MLEQVAGAVRVCRSLRYENPASFDDVTSEELEVVARGLRAIAYSCSEGARMLDRVREGRGPAHPVTSSTARTAAEILEERSS